MHHRLAAAAMAGVLSLSVTGSLYAVAPLASFHDTAQIKATAGKLVSFTVRNDSTEALLLQVGTEQMSVAPGKSVKLKLAEGAELVTVNATANRAAGSVLAKVDKGLQGNTLAIS